MILLDTHVLFWVRFGDAKLGRRARAAIDRATRRGSVAISAATLWEASMLKERGRLDLAGDIAAWRVSLLRDGLVEIPVDGAIAVRAGALRDMHGDPADRFILATALEGHQLITADTRLLDWPGELARLDARD